MSNKKFLAVTITISIVLTLGIMLVNFIIDPLQYYRQASLYTPVYFDEQRFQNPGLARSFVYNRVIIGTSMTENFSSDQFDQLFGGKTMKLSMSGSTAMEQRLIFELATKSNTVEEAVWAIDYSSFKGGPNNLQQQEGTFPLYMYDDSKWNDVKYLFNLTTSTKTAVQLANQFISTDHEKDLNNLYNWDKEANYDKETVKYKYNEAMVMEKNFYKSEESIEEMKGSFDQNVLGVVKNHPNTHFYFYFPPYSILRFSVWEQINQERYKNHFLFKEYVYETLSDYPNVEVYDFQHIKEISHNLDLFKDLSHHSQEVNEFIMKSIKNKDFILRDNNYRKINKLIQKQVEELDRNSL